MHSSSGDTFKSHSLLDPRLDSGHQLTSSVADIVGVAANAQFLINAPLDLTAVASQTNIDSAVSEAWGVQTAVD